MTPKILATSRETSNVSLFQNFVCSQSNEPVAALCLFLCDIQNCSSCRSPSSLTALRILVKRIFWKSLKITEVECRSLGRRVSGGGRFRLSESRCRNEWRWPVSPTNTYLSRPSRLKTSVIELSYLRCFEEEMCRSLRTATKIGRRKWKTGRIYPQPVSYLFP